MKEFILPISIVRNLQIRFDVALPYTGTFMSNGEGGFLIHHDNLPYGQPKKWAKFDGITYKDAVYVSEADYIRITDIKELL